MIILSIETATDRVGVALAETDSRCGGPRAGGPRAAGPPDSGPPDSGPPDSGGLLSVLASVDAMAARRHAETLHEAISACCRAAGVTLRDVGVIAVDTGPGLFTGLRVGVATAKGLAHGLGAPVVGIASLDVLASGAGLFPGPVIAIVDARRGEVFACGYRGHGGLALHAAGAAAASSGKGAAGPRAAYHDLPPMFALPRLDAAPLGSARLWTPSELAVAIAEWRRSSICDLAKDPLLLVGDGARRYANPCALGGSFSAGSPAEERAGPATASSVSMAGITVEAAVLGSGSHDHPSPSDLARVAAEQLATDPLVAKQPADIVPSYLRQADVRISWDKREQVPVRERPVGDGQLAGQAQDLVPGRRPPS